MRSQVASSSATPPLAGPFKAYDVYMTALGISLLIIGAIVVVAEAHVQSLGLLGGPGVVAARGRDGARRQRPWRRPRPRPRDRSDPRRGHRRRPDAVAEQGHGGPPAPGPRRTRGHDRPRRRRPELGRADGKVLVDGALWHARRSACEPDEEVAAPQGDRVIVERLNGLTLSVRPAEEWELIT